MLTLMKSVMHSRRGMAIVYVLLIVTVVTFVAVTIWQATEHSGRTAAREEVRSQAYFNARSGVEIAVGYILNDPENESFFDEDGVTYYGRLGRVPFSTTIPTDESGREDYNISFTIRADRTAGENDSDRIEYQIWSVGYDLARSEAVTTAQGGSVSLGFVITRELLEKSVDGELGGEPGPDIPPLVSREMRLNYAVFVKRFIDLDSGSPAIYGETGTNSGPVLMNYSSHIRREDGTDGVIYLGPGAEVSYPQWRTKDWEEIGFAPEIRFPALPDLPAAPEVPEYPAIPDASGIAGSEDISSGGTITLPAGSITKFGKVALGSNDILTFDMKGDATVFIDSLSSGGEIRLSGQGHLLMVVGSGIDGSRTVINSGGDPSRLTLYVTGSEIRFNSGGSGSSVSAVVFAPDADIFASYNTNIKGDIVTGGDRLVFNGVCHDGALYALNENAIIEYTGNRFPAEGTETFIYSRGKKLTVSPAHLRGDAYLTNPDAQVSLGSSTTFHGNILTRGKRIDVSGAAVLKGHIVAPNPGMEIRFSDGSSHEGAIISGGKVLSFTGGSVSVRGLLFAPEAEFLLRNGARVCGSIMSDSFSADGGSSVIFEEIVYDDLPVSIEPTELENTDTNWRVHGEWTEG
jgi:hypothetical protein